MHYFCLANGAHEGLRQASGPVEESFERMEGVAEPVFKGVGISRSGGGKVCGGGGKVCVVEEVRCVWWRK